MNHWASLALSVVGTAAFVGGVALLSGSFTELVVGSTVMMLGAGFLSVGLAQW